MCSLPPASAAPPSILLHPVDQRTTTGDTTRFATAGDPRIPATFQWYKNGLPIPAANTPNLIVRNTRPSDQASYHAVLKNADGEAHTRPATLNIHYRQLGPGVTDTTFLGPVFGSSAQAHTAAVTSEGKVLVGGRFSLPGRPEAHLLQLLPDGSLDPSFPPHTSTPDDQVRAIHVDPGGRALVVGDFTVVNGTPALRIARLLPDGSLDPSFRHDLGADNDILAAAVLEDGKILIAGKFLRVLAPSGWIDRPYLTRLLPDGEPDLTFTPTPLTGGPVLTIALDAQSRILAGGSFTRAGGIPNPRITRLTPDGTVDRTFHQGAGANFQVRSIAVTPTGHILIGGDFRLVHGVTRERFARLNPDGSLDLSFDAPCNLPVRHITPHPDGGYLVSGRFTEIRGRAFRRIAHIDDDGFLVTGFEPYAIDEEIRFATVTPDGKLLAVGDFSRPHDRIVRLHLASPLPTTPAILTSSLRPLKINEGDSKVISVVAASVPPPRYQWYHDGIQITGSITSELVIADASNDSNGTYSVEVTNEHGSVTSPPVSLRTSNKLPGTPSSLIVTARGTFLAAPGDTTLATVTVAPSFPVASVRVEIALTHPQTDQLDIDLISPSGRIVELFDGDRKSGRHLAGTTFDDNSPVSISSVTGAQPPYVGTFRPEEPLSDFIGQSSAGVWTLRIRDDRNSGPETPLHRFRLHLGRPPAEIGFTAYSSAFYIPADRDLDSNGDGHDNFTAFALATPPTDFLTPLTVLGPGTVSHRRWTHTPDLEYTYESSPDLKTWTPLTPSKTYQTLNPHNRSTVLQTFSPPPKYLRLHIADTAD